MLSNEFQEAVFSSREWHENQTLLVFGYGSLIWKPLFLHDRREFGFVRGFSRRFWQGNVTHRGVPGSPGRVATLVEDEQGETWGTVYQLRGRNQVEDALKHLITREMSKGGYEVRVVQVHTDHGKKTHENVFVFIATPDNSNYLGPAPVDAVARTVVRSRGTSGHNLEYVFNLIDALRSEEPRGIDAHLMMLEEACHRHLGMLAIEDSSPVHSDDVCQSNCNDEGTDCASCQHKIFCNDPYILTCIKTRSHHIRKHIDKLEDDDCICKHHVTT